MYFPSGEYTGFPSNPDCLVIRKGSITPVTGTVNKSPLVLIASILSMTAVKQISSPSGEKLMSAAAPRFRRLERQTNGSSCLRSSASSGGTEAAPPRALSPYFFLFLHHASCCNRRLCNPDTPKT